MNFWSCILILSFLSIFLSSSYVSFSSSLSLNEFFPTTRIQISIIRILSWRGEILAEEREGREREREKKGRRRRERKRRKKIDGEPPPNFFCTLDSLPLRTVLELLVQCTLSPHPALTRILSLPLLFFFLFLSREERKRYRNPRDQKEETDLEWTCSRTS